MTCKNRQTLLFILGALTAIFAEACATKREMVTGAQARLEAEIPIPRCGTEVVCPNEKDFICLDTESCGGRCLPANLSEEEKEKAKSFPCVAAAPPLADACHALLPAPTPPHSGDNAPPVPEHIPNEPPEIPQSMKTCHPEDAAEFICETFCCANQKCATKKKDVLNGKEITMFECELPLPSTLPAQCMPPSLP